MIHTDNIIVMFSSQFPVSPPGPGSRKLLALPTWRLGDQVLGHKEMVRLSLFIYFAPTEAQKMGKFGGKICKNM